MATRNLAAASLGARLEGSLAGKEWKPLLRHGEAFPTAGLSNGVAGVPQEFSGGCRLAEHLRTVDERWDNDCAISTFLPGDEHEDCGSVVVRLPDSGGYLRRLGFTYCPWDRNYGSICAVSVSGDGASWEEVGEIRTQWAGDRGNPAEEEVITAFVEVNGDATERVQRFVKFDWGEDGEGRRLYFLYVEGTFGADGGGVERGAVDLQGVMTPESVNIEAATEVGEVHVIVRTLAGDEYMIDLPATALLADVRDKLAQLTGWQPLALRFSIGATVLRDFSEKVTAHSGADGVATFSVVRAARKNQASTALGATLEGQYAGQEWKPLLRHSDAFPSELGGDVFLGVPEAKSLGVALAEHLHTIDERWNGDVACSTFVSREGILDDVVITVRLPGEGACLERVGFTYTPWDRNYGKRCSVLVSPDAKDWTEVGVIKTAWHRDRGDPSVEPVRTKLLDVPKDVAQRFQRFVRFQWDFSGDGRRLMFLYAVGYA
mmetsp:Transcript_43322/g.125227  ORF Transcript_43322/g.125227 Transcript_43322/m.125227 type:complete len:489 (-) Transcript_43322:46-1512(-)